PAHGALASASVVIWTTTPWTLPGNRAISFSPKIAYGLYKVTDAPADNWAKTGDLLILADALAEEVFKQARVTAFEKVRDIPGDTMDAIECAHPLKGLAGGYDFTVPLLSGDHVTDDTGTGFVHTAPSHGREDFDVLMANTRELDARGINSAIPYTVDENGAYTDQAPGFTGKRVINDKGEKGDANEAVIKALIEGGKLLARGRLKHQYPHSWRSKKPVIFRNTPQWFVAMDEPISATDGTDTLRARALNAISVTQWVPVSGQNRINGMIESRPDWVISRQRAWGVPIALYVHRETGDYLRDPVVNSRIIRAFHEGGADAWFGADHQALLGNGYSLEEYEPVADILDVWFDSGSTHAYVVEARYGQGVRADLYVEGSDQHRGWFQSSLLESCGTRGRAPYEAVLTHGFALDQNMRKMSKSLGNTVDPLAVIKESGADILRLWAASTDYFEDVRIGREVLATTTDAYRKLRNTFRYLLGALDGFTDEERVPAAQMPELERWVLHRLAELDSELRQAANDFEFNRYVRLIAAFANEDLSAFFFDIRKDSLYCDAPSSPKRRAYRTVLDTVFHALVRWLAPVLCFTAEEVWQTRFPGEGSVHLLEWPEIEAAWRDPALGSKWGLVRASRERVTEAIEPLRREKVIGSSLEAKVLYPAMELDFTDEDLEELAEIYIVSEVVPGETDSIEAARTERLKCGRCWRHLPEVEEEGALCARCDEVVNG
ncbi:MAG: isoleucine--tRNA ligase, partial [Alphaproteobacteria bacterium]|nr:isoleucine--tRNA ligase [Alphaproteobacteria bacterium]